MHIHPIDLVLQIDKFICCPTSSPFMMLQTVLFNLVLVIVLEGANDEMKEKHLAQQFCDKAVKLLRSQYRRLAMQRWAAKVRAEAMLERGARAFFVPDPQLGLGAQNNGNEWQHLFLVGHP